MAFHRKRAGSVNDEGGLGWVEQPGDRPKPVEREMTHEYAAGAFLLAGSEIIQLRVGEWKIEGQGIPDFP